MTNQPDESHPLRKSVDEAISWFTQTDEPPEAPPVPVAEQSAPVVERPAPVVEGSAPTLEERTPVAEPGAVMTPAAVSEPTTSEPVAREAVVPAEPAPAVVTPAGAPAGPAAAFGTVPVGREPDIAPERVYEADEFSSHPVVPEPYEPEPADVATERVSEADDFMPAHAVAAPAPVAPEPVVAAEPAVAPVGTQPVVAAPVANPIEPSAVEEPTRIHPIEPPSSWAEVHPEPHLIPENAIDSEAETTGSQRSLFRDEAPSVALPLGAAAAGAAGFTATAQVPGAPVTGHTAVLDAQEMARLRREERAARDRQLGKVIAAPDTDEPMVTRFSTPSTYKGLPSFGLVVFRLVIAAVVGIRAYQHITHLTATRDMWAATIMPSPGIVAYAQIGLEIAIAVMLLIGLGTRIAGLALTLLSIAVLVFVQWGVVSPFQPGATDFIGVVEVLLAGTGLLLATVGGGRIAFDGAIHSGRIRRKNDKLFS